MKILIVLGVIIVIVVAIVLVRRALKSISPEATPARVRPPVHSPAAISTSPPVVTAEASQEIERLLSQGDMISAVKLVREQTGLGIAAAKKLVDSWPNGVSIAQGQPAAPAAAVPPAGLGVLPPDVIAQVDHLVATDQRVEAVKVFREATGATFEEATQRIKTWVPRGGGS